MLRWDNTIPNMVKTKECNPVLSKICKQDSWRRNVAGNLVLFVGDVRVMGFCLKYSWAIAKWMASQMIPGDFKIQLSKEELIIVHGQADYTTPKKSI